MRVADLYHYPVKSLRGTRIERSPVDQIGLRSDRVWMVVDGNGNFQTIRQRPVMAQIAVQLLANGIVLQHPLAGKLLVEDPLSDGPSQSVTVWRDTVQALIASDEAAAFLSLILQSKVSLVRLSHSSPRHINPDYSQPQEFNSFSDGYPVLLTSTSSLQDLEQRLGTPVDMRRFRPNIVVEGAPAWAEDNWRIITIGKVRFRVAKPCARCIVTTRDPDSGAQLSANEPLLTLGRIHRAGDGGIIFGQNLIPERLGEIQRGDAVEIIEAGSSNLD